MTYEISSNVCEICKKQAKVAMNDYNEDLHYACDNPKHISKVWDKVGKP